MKIDINPYLRFLRFNLLFKNIKELPEVAPKLTGWATHLRKLPIYVRSLGLTIAATKCGLEHNGQLRQTWPFLSFEWRFLAEK